MKILLLCDRESTSYNGWDLRSQVQLTLQATGVDVDTVVLNGDEIKPCLGCYKCWVKTPGFCTMTDDCANLVGKQEIQADLVIFLAQITYGGFSYDLKSFIDRSIPNLSPYFEIVHGDMRHAMRYERFPDLISIGYGAASPEERQTFIDLAERNFLIMRPQKYFVFTLPNVAESSGELSDGFSAGLNDTMQALKNVLLREMEQ
ncbi:MAG: NAD(P)H-dependent oxidoreductase [Firmicutes bacterium]|nr:NAD(P)H-dependent oxidoreductase [Bacillota bacterium]